MRYATPEAFRAALEDRLKHAQNEQVGLSRLRKRVVFERLLARLTGHLRRPSPLLNLADLVVELRGHHRTPLQWWAAESDYAAYFVLGRLVEEQWDDVAVDIRLGGRH
jgi:hypothetical protein